MNKRMKKTAVAVAVSAATVAHNALFPVLCAYQDRTTENVAVGASRSSIAVETLLTLRSTSTDFAADCVILLGDGKTKDGVTGTLAESLNAKYGSKVIHPNVRAEVVKWRKVANSIDVPAVRDAAPKGIRAMYDATRAPKAKDDAAIAPAAPVAYSQAMMVALVAEHFDDAVFAMRAYLLRAADAIAVGKIGELEVHLHSKTRKS